MTALLLAHLRRALAEEIDTLPGQSLVYGRPHESTRAYSVPRYSLTGERIPGLVTFFPDCHEPDGDGVCGHPPDGTWRPFPGVTRADALAQHLEADDGLWRMNVYERGGDGLWRCRWPYRRAMDRLANRNPRQAIVLWRLIEGVELRYAYLGFREPAEPSREVIGLLRSVLSWAGEEMEAEYDRRPRLFPRMAWMEKSEAQERAEA